MAETQEKGTRSVVRNISDTARWAAVFRARETERPDAMFRDPYAEGLAGTIGDRGYSVAEKLAGGIVRGRHVERFSLSCERNLPS